MYHIPTKGLVSRIYKEPSKPNKKNIKHPTKKKKKKRKQAKDLKRHLTKENTVTPEKHIRRYEHSWSLSKCKIKPHWDTTIH